MPGTITNHCFHKSDYPHYFSFKEREWIDYSDINEGIENQTRTISRWFTQQEELEEEASPDDMADIIKCGACGERFEATPEGYEAYDRHVARRHRYLY
jgi:hypothetical protein